MNKQIEIFSFSPAINLAEEGKWLLAVTSFEAKNSIFNINNEKTSFQSLHLVIGFLEEIQKQLLNYEN